MKKFLLRSIALLLCLTALLSFAACKSYEAIEPEEQDVKVVGKVGDFEVLYEEIRFMVLSRRGPIISKYDDLGMSEEELDAKVEEKLWEYLSESILTNYAVLHMCRELGIEATEEKLLAAVQLTVEETIDSCGSTSKYKKYLSENHLTDHFLRFNTCVDKMQNELFYAYRDDLGLIENEDDKIYDIISSEFLRTQHIYISKENGKTEAENKEILDTVMEEIASGKDFFEIAKVYNEDTSLTSDGVYLTKGYMSEKYEEAAYLLGIDECSGVVEDEEGYYIIKRLKQDPLYVMIHFDELSDRYQHYAFIGMIDEYAETLEFVPNDYLKSLKLVDIE
ncbi:MAG: hypothetical protein E7641_05305 [Ruminococcaceae bacterium]|nr:hypothetical protein [Oscillospiraceae bacterium]